MAPTPDQKIVLTTVGSVDEAGKIAAALVERKLAACVNILPQMQSFYRWEGRVDRADEFLLLIKTDAQHFPAVRDAIQQLHSYDLPECICIDIGDGSPEYLKWITGSLG